MQTTTTGEEILAYCSSCKMDLLAIIAAKVDTKIAKVECKTCKKEHKYKEPKGITSPKGKSQGVSQAKQDVSLEWKKLMDEAAKANRVKYSLKAKLSLGDLVIHQTFGEGIVTRLSYPNKAEVIFKEDVKMLVHSRT